jgi:hypothetical protein
MESAGGVRAGVRQGGREFGYSSQPSLPWDREAPSYSPTDVLQFTEQFQIKMAYMR